MNTLLKLHGEKLPQEKVWVDAEGMYEVYDKIDVNIDNSNITKYIITDITDDGLIVTTLN